MIGISNLEYKAEKCLQKNIISVTFPSPAKAFFFLVCFLRRSSALPTHKKMPWTKSEYPDSLKNFMAPIRNKAIEIANALIAQGRPEDAAIAIATEKAKEWGENRGKKIRKSR